MKSILKIITAFFLLSILSCSTSLSGDNKLLRVCPEKYFEDRMPRIIDTQNPDETPHAYFIYNKERHEIAEFDTAWVWKNCEVEKEIVY